MYHRREYENLETEHFLVTRTTVMELWQAVTLQENGAIMKIGLTLVTAWIIVGAVPVASEAVDWSYEPGQEHDYPWVSAQSITEQWIDRMLTDNHGVYLYNFKTKSLDKFSQRTVLPFRTARSYIPPGRFFLNKYKELLPKAQSQLLVLVELQDCFDQEPGRIPGNDRYLLPRN